ncbi:hypothetical protein G210_1107, partial [Candida maltosa Xu316]
MSSRSLSILPNEVLEIIFELVPKETLVKFKEIQQNHAIQTLLYELLYSHITIGESAPQLHSNILPSKSPHGYPTENSFEFLTTTDFIKTIKADPRIKPSRFLFAKFRTILIIHEQTPHVLKDAKIDINEAKLNFKDYSTEELDIIFSYSISSVGYFTTSIDNIPYTRYLRNVNIQCSQVGLDNVSKFSNMTYLELNDGILPDQARLIPRSVTELKCDMDFRYGIREVEPEFPEILERLNLIGYGRRRTYDLHLEKLQKLKILKLDITTANVILPNNITDLETKTWISVQSWHGNCPNLDSLMIWFGPDIEEIEIPGVISFPCGLKKLLLPYEMVYDSSNSPIPMDFPGKLKDFTITVTEPDRNKIILDKCNLNNLKSFTVYDFASTGDIIVAQFPQNLHNLSLLYVENIEEVLSEIQQLDSLHELTISHTASMPSKFNAPSSLKILTLNANKLKEISIIGKNIEVLSLRCNDIRYLDNDTLTLPENLQELDLSGNMVGGISRSFAWPRTLRELDLGHNFFSMVPNLPDWLEVLHCFRFARNENILEEFTIPTNLKYLNLRDTNLNGENLFKITWSRSQTLREVNLAGNNLQHGIFLALLPESLEYLNLDRNCFTEINEIHLCRLSNLKEISICDNTTEFNFTSLRQKLKKRNVEVLCFKTEENTN